MLGRGGEGRFSFFFFLFFFLRARTRIKGGGVEFVSRYILKRFHLNVDFSFFFFFTFGEKERESAALRRSTICRSVYFLCFVRLE